MKVLYSYSKTTVPKSAARNIPQQPDRILDAPDLLDDYCKNSFNLTRNFESRVTYKSFYMDIIHFRFEPFGLVDLQHLGCSPGDGHLSLECHYMYHSTASKHAG